MVLIFHDELISSQESHPLLVNPPYNLTLTVNELTTPKNSKGRQTKSADHDSAVGAVDNSDEEDFSSVPRPHNAFIIFRNDFAAKMKNSNSSKKISIRLISQMASRQWKKEPENVKTFFKILSDMYQHRHRILYPGYKYSPKTNASRNSASSRRNVLNKRKARRDELKGKKKGRIITWYIHDTTDKKAENDAFRHTDLSICNPEDLKISYFQQKTYHHSQPATFINYTSTPDAPVILHSTSTTSAPPAQPVALQPPTFINVEDSSYPFYDVISDKTSPCGENVSPPHDFISLDPSSTSSPGSPPSNEFWAETSNDNKAFSHFEFFDFGTEQLFDI